MTDREALEYLDRLADGATNLSHDSNEACRIGAEAVRERMEREECGANTALTRLLTDEAPTVDAGPVVRCKDCDKKFIPQFPKNQVWCREHRCYKKPDDFCSCGERRTDNGTN